MDKMELTKLDDEMLDAYTGHDVEVILSHCSDDVLMQDYGAPPAQGKDAAREHLMAQFAVFSGEKATRIHRIIGDSEVFSELDWSATNTGDIPMPDGSSVPATGKFISASLAYYARVNEGGEVVEIRGYPDIANLMGQLGVMG